MSSGNKSMFQRLTRGLKFDKVRFRKDFITLGHKLPEVQSLEAAAIDDQKNKEGTSLSQHDRDTQSQGNSKKANKRRKAALAHEALNKHSIEMARLRSKHNITAKGADLPDPITDFNELVSKYGVNESLVKNLLQQGYTEPTPIQMQTWPLMLRGREMLATAPTGSGKTAAFLLPLIHQLKSPRALGFRAVIVSPTRELAEQTFRECNFLCTDIGLKVHLIDKVDKVVQKFGPNTSQKFDILVTTPNRLVFILKDDNPLINLNNVEWLVVDECDRLFEGGKRGFRDQLATIYQACTGPRIHRAFFSATHANELQQWCQLNLNNMATVGVGARNTASSDVKQELVFCGDESGKIHAFRNILRQGYEPPCLVFVQTKERARQLFFELVADDIMVDAIHADRTQKQREACVQAFRAKKIWVLICTELMSRGIDFKGVNLVVNYDFPPTMTSYIHRIGRTGRAQHKGRAITFWTANDQHMLYSLVRTMGSSGNSEVPEWMQQLRRLAPHEKHLSKAQKNRGFVSESAKLTKAEQDKRKKRQLSRKLTEMRTAGEADTKKYQQLKMKLRALMISRKENERKEISKLDKVEALRKIKRERKLAKKGDAAANKDE